MLGTAATCRHSLAATHPEAAAAPTLLTPSCCLLQQILTWDFDWRYMVRGLVIDKKRGNMLKIDRHKYVKLAYHGFKRMSRDQRRDIYSNNAVPHAWPATKGCCYWVLSSCLHLQPLLGMKSWAAAKPQATAATMRLLCHGGMHALHSGPLQDVSFCRVASWIPAGHLQLMLGCKDAPACRLRQGKVPPWRVDLPICSPCMSAGLAPHGAPCPAGPF